MTRSFPWFTFSWSSKIPTKFRSSSAQGVKLRLFQIPVKDLGIWKKSFQDSSKFCVSISTGISRKDWKGSCKILKLVVCSFIRSICTKGYSNSMRVFIDTLCIFLYWGLTVGKQYVTSSTRVKKNKKLKVRSNLTQAKGLETQCQACIWNVQYLNAVEASVAPSQLWMNWDSHFFHPLTLEFGFPIWHSNFGAPAETRFLYKVISITPLLTFAEEIYKTFQVKC